MPVYISWQQVALRLVLTVIAGAILRKNNLVLGVTTAATVWFSTVMGLCVGGGQIGLGIAATFVGFGTLWELKYVEGRMRQDLRATLFVLLSKEGPDEVQLRGLIESGGRRDSWGTSYVRKGECRHIVAEIERRILPSDTRLPQFVVILTQAAGVESVRRQPQGLSDESKSERKGPQGTLVSISAGDS